MSEKDSHENHSNVKVGTNKRDRAIILLVLQAFFQGFAFGLMYNVAYTLLALEFGSDGLKIVYLIVGIVVPLVSLGFNEIEGKLHLAKTSILTNVLFILCYVFLYILSSIYKFTWMPVVLMVITIMGILYSMMLRGSQATEIYDARDIKKKYPLITGGEMFATVLAGILVYPLSRFTGSLESLMILGGASILIALLVVRILIRDYLAPIEAHHHHCVYEQSKDHLHGWRSYLSIIRKRYTLLVFGYQMIGSMLSLLIQYIVYAEAQNFFVTRDEMSRFIGLVKAGTTIVSFLFLTFAAGKLLTRYGMPVGLAGSPVCVALILFAVVISAFFDSGNGQIFFGVIVASQFIDYMLYSGFVKTSVQSAFQILNKHERDFVHIVAQGLGIPLSYGVIGGILLLFGILPGFTTNYAVYLAIGITFVSGWIGYYLYRSYSSQLRKALSRQSIEEMELNLNDASTMEVLNRMLEADEPWLVKTGFDLLENAAHPSYLNRVKNLLESAENDLIKTDMLERIEKEKPEWAKSVAKEFLKDYDAGSVKAAAIRVLCATVDDPCSEVMSYLDTSFSEIKNAAISGLFLYGGINGILKAGNIFNKMLESDSPDERISAASILERTGIRNFYHPLIKLLQDSDERVVIAALRASKSVLHPILIPEIVNYVDPINTRSDALFTIAAYGDEAVSLLKKCFQEDSQISKPTALRIIRSFSRVSSIEVISVLENELQLSHDPEVDAQLYSVLSQRRYCAKGDKREVVIRLIKENANITARVLLAITELEKVSEDVSFLISALKDLYNRELNNVFTLCSLIYTPDEIFGIQRKIMEGTKKQRALGSELLDVLLEPEIKRYVISIVENVEEKFDSNVFKDIFGLSLMSPKERVKEIVDDNKLWFENWVRSCAFHAAYTIGISETDVNEKLLLIIERVMSLKNADIFSNIPDNALVHVASICVEVVALPDESFIKLNEIGDCMYIIRNGKVSVHDGKIKFAELTAGHVVGEMAVLSPEPRSAFVTAIEETNLLKIDKDAFDSVMADHPKIAGGVIKVLCGRIRATMKNI